MKPGGEGRKGGLKRRRWLYEEEKSCTQENLQPFTEGNNASQRCSNGKKRLGLLSNEFTQCQLAVVPFDIIISYNERWLHLNRNRKADSQPLYIASSVKKLTKKYYCI